MSYYPPQQQQGGYYQQPPPPPQMAYAPQPPQEKSSGCCGGECDNQILADVAHAVVIRYVTVVSALSVHFAAVSSREDKKMETNDEQALLLRLSKIVYVKVDIV
ncbi:hypothetical protein E3Q23_00408 [Wallemia mellicola]|uniref:Uncharacterized protein n=1 Tax=Wallemia mellicola TaxID=1708541 RepID=A0A4T0P432_9BASI|nr:hypothetical protein E3Q23_00408 [Wallemia mellicola]TIB84293.1 hypothetical protein E3Q21_02460 [Wallemia mellicola]TIB87518.1 hypothetical protein E3Q20_02412 [Wallemia mellicola]TIB92018.1 hypothetical protein E3Q19_02135 [Wallemia mellicola]TIC00211.1 hypothetical protein E3Q17_02293 [Wallemia mellicola]